MNYIVGLLMVGSAQGIWMKTKANKEGCSLTGICPEVYAYVNPSHWKKKWPEGAVDTTSDDVHAEWEVVDRFNHPAAPPAKKDHSGVWVEYEPHTTSMEDQWQGLHH